MIRVLIVDDHELVRIGLSNLLSSNEKIIIVEQASGVKESIQKAKKLKPDIVIMDIRLSDGSGIEACKEICRKLPKTKVIMLTSFLEDDLVVDSIIAGASGFVLKEVKGTCLIEVIEKVYNGETLFDSTLTGNLISYIRKKEEEDNPSYKLTSQELKILSLVAEGKTNKEIAQDLFISERTVRNHLSHAMKKLKLSNRVQVASYYLSLKKIAE